MYCSESQDPFPQSCEDHLGHTTVTCISSFLWQFANTIQKTAVVQRKICKLKAEQVIVTGHIVILYDHQAPSAKFKTKPASCFSTWTDTSWTMPSATLRKSKWDRRSKPELFLQNKHLSKLLLNIWISFEYLWLESEMFHIQLYQGALVRQKLHDLHLTQVTDHKRPSLAQVLKMGA